MDAVKMVESYERWAAESYAARQLPVVEPPRRRQWHVKRRHVVEAIAGVLLAAALYPVMWWS